MKKTDYLNKQQKFENLTFNEFISESNFSTKEDIIFSECTFKQPLVLTNINTRKLSFFLQVQRHVFIKNIHAVW